jgi:hypothetical protein
MRGRGAAERGRGRAQRPSVGVVGWPPESSAGFRGARPQDRSHGSVVRNGAVTFASARLRRRVFVQSTEPEVVTEKALEGQKPRRAPARSAVGFFGRKLEGLRGRSRERTPGGSKASKRAKRPRAGEPEGLLCRSSRSPCGATRAVDRRSSRSRGNHVPLSSVSNACPLHGGLRARLGRGAGWKPVGQPGNLRAGDTVDVEPARKHKAVERRHGSSGRESSEGRIPGTCAVGQPIAKLRGVATTELRERGNPSLQESARLKPPRGNGSTVGCAARRARSDGRSPRAEPDEGCNPRLPRSVKPIVAETGHPESTS